MKKILFLIIVLFSLNCDAQYHNIRLNENTTFNGEILDSCYIVINEITIPELSLLKATYLLSIYKNKSTFLENADWKISPVEVQSVLQVQFDASFTQGDLFLKCSEKLVEKFILENPTWNINNITIE